jgi:hypothetical protein
MDDIEAAHGHKEHDPPGKLVEKTLRFVRIPILDT